MSEDVVNNPHHYNQNGIEVIDVIETYAKSDFRLANVIKYVCRCEYKGKKLEDLKKAQWYLARVIEELEDEAVHAHFDSIYVQPSPDRIAGDDDAAQGIKARYYEYNADEIISVCKNPACMCPIYANELYVTDEKSRMFCSTVCEQMVHAAEARR